MKLVKTLLHTQLKQTYLENRLHISTECPKEGFNDTVFQHFQHCKWGVQKGIQLVPVFLCLYSLDLVVMLPFKMIFFITCFPLFFVLVNLQYFNPLLQDLFVIFNENLSQ